VMGEMADYFLDKMLQNALEPKIRTDQWEDMVWVTKNNGPILIRRMTDFHLKNSIKMLEKTMQTNIPEYSRMVEEVKKRESLKEVE
jgi:hypothetical protein